MAKTMAQLEATWTTPAEEHACAQQLYTALKERSPQELVHGLYHLLSKSVFNSCAQQQELERACASERERPSSSSSYRDRSGSDRSNRGNYGDRRRGGNNNNNQLEIMFNVGLDDGVTKQDLLKHVQLAKSLKGERVGRVHVINKRSFVTVAPHVAEHVQRELNGKPLCGRSVRVTMA
jgi:hypothetical protein